MKKILMSVLLVSLFSCSEQEAVEKLKKADAKDFSFTVLSVNAKEVTIEQIKSILKKPAGWTIKSIKIDDTSFAAVTGTSIKDLKITIKKTGEFSFSITLQKTGYEDFVLKGKILAASLKADAKDFSFTTLPVNAKEVTIEQLKKNLKAPAGWTIKSIKIDDTNFAEVTGTSVKDLKITIKRGGTFTINITLQKAGYEDFVLKGKILAASLKADANDFSFTTLPVNAKAVTIEQIKKNLKAPAGWTIKSIKIDNTSFADVDSKLKITIKKSGEFSFSITLQKTGWVDFVLKGSIKASQDYLLLIFDKATKTITGVTDKNIKTINIPNEIDGVAVTTIGKKAFFNCSSLTSVTIPNSVTTIGDGAFYGCSSLTSVTIPNSVTTIGISAFYECSSLTSVTIPNSVTTIGDDAFYGCSSLTSVTIPNSVTTIGSSAFSHCSSLTSVTIPNSVTTIGDDAFYRCSSLTSVTIPNSVTTIGERAFNGCSSLTSVTIPNSVTTIGERAFNGCSSLTSVTIPNSVTTIGERAFNGCSSLTSVTIPNSVTTIGEGAFSVCSSLTSVTIPNSVTTIGGGAFSRCSSLTSVTIPNSVTTIGRYAFSHCSSLTSVTIPNSVTTIGERAFNGCSSLTSVTIPNSVTTIGGWAFYECSSLTIRVPKSVNRIGYDAFYGVKKVIRY